MSSKHFIFIYFILFILGQRDGSDQRAVSILFHFNLFYFILFYFNLLYLFQVNVID